APYGTPLVRATWPTRHPCSCRRRQMGEPGLKVHSSTPAPAKGEALSAAIEPLLLGAAQAAALCGVSRPSWWRLHAAHKIPAPVRVGHRTLWRRSDLVEWIRLGCPDRAEFQARAAAGST